MLLRTASPLDLEYTSRKHPTFYSKDAALYAPFPDIIVFSYVKPRTIFPIVLVSRY